jgi:hypothetical protein
MFVPICYYFGRVSHIQPYCYMLRSRELKSETTPPKAEFENLINIIKDVVSG